MNKNETNNREDQEIDLRHVFNKIGNFFGRINTGIFNCIQFFIKNVVVILILAVVGFGLGIFWDLTQKNYKHQIIVMPNFGSNDYLYSKINLLNSKINENDTVFLKEIGFTNIKAIEIEPIIDIYQFTASNPQNFELLKLMGEDGDLNKIIAGELTSKNYLYHQLLINSSKKASNEGLIKPLLKYLNVSDYFLKVQKEKINSTKLKMNENDSIIKQIDGILNGFRKNIEKDSRSASLVYYNENTQLNDIIKTKNDLITEKAVLRLSLINYEKIIKDISVVTNLENRESINGKMKFIAPFILILIFVVIHALTTFIRKQFV
jgi:hypothetical protein